MAKPPLQDAKTACIQELAGNLVDAADILDSWSLKRCTNLTLIARDPDNDDMIIVVTNEKDLKAACAAALRNETRPLITLEEKHESQPVPKPAVPGRAAKGS